MKAESSSPRLDIRSAFVVWCQGYQAIRNRWFPTIPDGPAKGEILRVRLSDYTEDRVVHKGIWLVPDEFEGDRERFFCSERRTTGQSEQRTHGRRAERTSIGPETNHCGNSVVIDHVAAVRAGMKRRKTDHRLTSRQRSRVCSERTWFPRCIAGTCRGCRH